MDISGSFVSLVYFPCKISVKEIMFLDQTFLLALLGLDSLYIYIYIYVGIFS